MASLQGIYAIVNDGEHVIALFTNSYLNGGLTLVQYRAKAGIHGERLRTLREITRAHGALLIVNDDWRAAMEYGCDGVHLGPGDDGFDDPQRVRDAAGPLIIGLSCGTVEEARVAVPGVVDYIGTGPVYATGSKADAGEPIGIAGLKAVAAASSVPVAAIGGITLGNVDAVRASGVAMASIISALAEAPDPRAAAHAFSLRWNNVGHI